MFAKKEFVKLVLQGICMTALLCMLPYLFHLSCKISIKNMTIGAGEDWWLFIHCCAGFILELLIVPGKNGLLYKFQHNVKNYRKTAHKA